jgi:hypothetical protein
MATAASSALFGFLKALTMSVFFIVSLMDDLKRAR